MDKHLTISEMMDKIKGEFSFHQDFPIQEGEYSIDNHDKLISRDKFCSLFNNILDEHFTLLIKLK